LGEISIKSNSLLKIVNIEDIQPDYEIYDTDYLEFESPVYTEVSNISGSESIKSVADYNVEVISMVNREYEVQLVGMINNLPVVIIRDELEMYITIYEKEQFTLLYKFNIGESASLYQNQNFTWAETNSDIVIGLVHDIISISKMDRIVTDHIRIEDKEDEYFQTKFVFSKDAKNVAFIAISQGIFVTDTQIDTCSLLIKNGSEDKENMIFTNPVSPKFDDVKLNSLYFESDNFGASKGIYKIDLDSMIIKKIISEKNESLAYVYNDIVYTLKLNTAFSTINVKNSTHYKIGENLIALLRYKSDFPVFNVVDRRNKL